MGLGSKVKGSSLCCISVWRAELNICFSTTVRKGRLHPLEQQKDILGRQQFDWWATCVPWMGFLLWRQQTEKRENGRCNRRRGAFSRTIPSHRGFGEKGGECFKSEIKREGGVYSAPRSKNWMKKDWFSDSLKSQRETEESQALKGLWNYNWSQ